MNTLINSLFNGLNDLSPRDLMIRKKSCVADTGDVYVAEVELAGFSKKDINISIVDGVVELEAKNKDRSQKFKLHLNEDIPLEKQDKNLTFFSNSRNQHKNTDRYISICFVNPQYYV